jgi:hypothetical protein
MTESCSPDDAASQRDGAHALDRSG